MTQIMNRIKSPVLALADACPPLLGAAFGHRGLISLYAIVRISQVLLQYSRKKISSEYRSNSICRCKYAGQIYP